MDFFVLMMIVLAVLILLLLIWLYMLSKKTRITENSKRESIYVPINPENRNFEERIKNIQEKLMG